MTSIDWYEANAETFFARSIDADMLPQMKAFAALLPRGARVLDAGCGSGRDAKALKAMGFEVTATEAAPALACLAEAHAGVRVHVMTFEQMSWREAFDGIWACASLLHVRRAGLSISLQRLRRALVPDGVCFMSFKYGSEEREANGRWFTDLDESGASALLANVGGLELVSMEVTADVRPERVDERWLSLIVRRAG